MKSEIKTVWRPIATFDKSQMQFVLVRQDGATRVHLWVPEKRIWERPFPIGSIVEEGDICCEPTEWMPIPD